jgi:hypothetical protein
MRIYANDAWIWMYSSAASLYMDISLQRVHTFREDDAHFNEEYIAVWLKRSIGVFVEVD